MESGNDVPAIPARLTGLVNWQDAILFAASDPRKLLVSVRSSSKHTSYGIPLIRAQ